MRTKYAPLMTVADFLDWPGDGSGSKFQLVDGEPRAMAPGSATHAIGTEPGVMTRVRADLNLRFPDLGVSCTPNEPGHRSFPDPVLLIEVLSPTNQSETWENVWAYCTIPSVREILVVHSTRARAQLLRRDPADAWPSEPEFISQDAILRLETIALASPLLDVYANTHLAR